MVREDLEEKIKALREQMSVYQKELDELEANQKKASLESIEAIRQEIRSLLDSAGQHARLAGVSFFRDTFIQGIGREDAQGYWGSEREYWQSSEYC